MSSNKDNKDNNPNNNSNLIDFAGFGGTRFWENFQFNGGTRKNNDGDDDDTISTILDQVDGFDDDDNYKFSAMV